MPSEGSTAKAVLQLGPVPSKAKQSPRAASRAGEDALRLAAYRPGWGAETGRSSWNCDAGEDEEASCLLEDSGGSLGGGKGGGPAWPGGGAPLQPLPPGGGRWPPPALCTALVAMIAFFFSYLLSLRGGSHSRDLAWSNAHLGQLAAALVAAVASLTTALWATVAFPPELRRLAWQLRGGLLALFLFFVVWDHGNDFQYHGMYNALLLVVICVPLNLAIAGLYLWCRAMPSWRAYFASLAAVGAVVAVALVAGLVHYQRVWYVGFWGRRMALGSPTDGGPADCSYPTNLPWVDLLPGGAQNFWTGSQTCKATQHFDAEFSDEGLLTIRGCRNKEAMSYTQLPDTRKWPTDWKRYHKASFQSHVLGHMKAEVYTQPVQLSSEAVLARCGEEERLLLRVQPLRERPPPESPLLSTRPGGSNSSSSDAAGGAPGTGNSTTSTSSSQIPRPLNVMVFFIDSVSRRHFFRRLPASAKALERIHAHRKADLYQFFRYHTVGFSTDPNTHAMYTGTTFPTPEATPVWQAFRRAGYVSGSAYNLCEGWGADYNDLANRHDHELIAPFCDPEYHPVTPDGEPYQIFRGAFSILRRCLRGRFVHRYNFDYTRSFLRAYHGNTPYLLLNSFHEGHEGTGEVLATIDGDFAAFLEELTPDQLNSTLVLVVADHGLTMGLNFLLAENGRVEHKNPFLGVLAPTWLPSAYPALAAALRGNEQRLFTAFDIHTTLHHVLHLADPNPAAAAAAAAGGAALPGQYPGWAAAGNVSAAVHWGTSLLTPIPAGRTCDDAHVPPDNCMCH